ncbi:hypothetical protein EDD86DRAFT_203591 [Gorgonomyces haynaldii]|nr:hypothetical protein EDD86DRAFT_203591 [Gorgonomyces haynaldii]
MLKFIEKVSIGFAPLSRASRSTRTFISRLKTKKNLQENVKCQMDIQMKDSIKKPFIEIIFTDKHKMQLQPELQSCEELVQDVKRYTKRLQLEQDIKEAS